MLGFIILHYKTIDETIECLQNIKKLNDSNKIKIIVVDNNTLSEEEYEKIKKYTKDIIKLDSNMGYAKANNIGINYAKKKYNLDYYFVINNDVYIYQKDILKRINDIYKKYKFDMLGCKILSPTGESVNPFPVINDINSEINRCNKLIKIYKSPIKTKIIQLLIKIKHHLKKPVMLENAKNTLLYVPLHGCAILFSSKYVNKYNDPFYPNTFLFHEEEFLYERVKNDHLLSVYTPDIEVFHKEGTSVSKSLKKARLSKLFREEERLKSLILLREVKNNGKE